MPPQICRSSLSCISKCNPSLRPVLASQNFSTSTRSLNIGPENPKFIEVPQAPQQYEYRPQRVRGVLPVPRKVFGKAYDRIKVNPLYLEAATPEPQRTGNTTSLDERAQWKRSLAATRRTNLQEGIKGLWKRKRTHDISNARKSRDSRRARKERLNAPQREDERLTNPTITEAVAALQIGHIPDPNREARVAASRERMAAQEAERLSARRDALHTLYMNAREFITTEEQLNQKIDEIFTDEPFGEDVLGKTNIWDAYGAPPTVRDMLLDAEKTKLGTVMAYQGAPQPAAATRMKRIAEELTGGKMDGN